ncbi:cell adhesion molecule 2-like [Penaeus monodon]|uniref:cell adhesion molecule 2-like n=1 Tax=Penaeus monodon TaxID=6687 RepID=UPI0018A745CA|nr:cell adhesion molecule 2-like [Penaeus monodon]
MSTLKLSTSDENVVTLRKIDLSSEGTYRCEVMSEAPTFETSFGSANLTVVHMPQNPQITGLQIKYTEGDTLRINCTVRDSRPPAVISFRVNGREMHPDSGRVIELPTSGGGDDPYALYTTSSQLILPLGKNHLNGITVECEGKVLNLAVKKSVFAAVVRQSSTFSFFNAGAPRVNPPTMILVVVSAALTHLLNT